MDNFDISKPIEERVDPEFVTDYLLERFTIAGTPAECIAKVKRLEADGVKRILLTPPNADLRSSDGQVGQRSDSEILGNRHEATGNSRNTEASENAILYPPSAILGHTANGRADLRSRTDRCATDETPRQLRRHHGLSSTNA